MAYEKRLEQEKLKREQILSAWDHSRNGLLEREKQQISEKKKKTNIQHRLLPSFSKCYKYNGRTASIINSQQKTYEVIS